MCSRSLALLLFALPLLAQSPASIRGVVRLDSTSEGLHNARVLLLPGNRIADTDREGRYEFLNLAPGKYKVIARAQALTDESQEFDLQPGQSATADFRLRIQPVKETITITASGREESTADALVSVQVLETVDLNIKLAGSLGEVLDGQTGVAKRSFGPGTSRPVIRGFDGDRVLVMTDNIPTATLSSQSGDHGEPLDPTSLERIEVVRGPSTLLYGSNAIGGVINAISRHGSIHQIAHPGSTGYVTAVGGSTNNQFGGSGGFDLGLGNWQLWADGGGQRTTNFNTPLGVVENSQTRNYSTNAGFGHYTKKRFLSFEFGRWDARYGIPAVESEEEHAEHAEEHEAEEEGHHHEIVDLTPRRNAYRFNFGLRDLGRTFDALQLSLNYSDYTHSEEVERVPETTFWNRQFSYRGLVQQAPRGMFSGSFGFSGFERRFRSEGAESLSPPVSQNNWSLFGLETLDLERVKLQFGGRLERNGYSPNGLQARSFLGFSGAASAAVPLWTGGALTANYTHSFRSPALEELYFNGPHPGNLAYEIGNPNLSRERGDGFEVSLRQNSRRFRGEVNYFFHHIHDFVYMRPTGVFEDGLQKVLYSQADTRYQGLEARMDAALRSDLWLNLALDSVNARFALDDAPLPRIPPVRGRAALDYRWKGFNLRPELVLARPQNSVFSTETPTAGYGLFNLGGGYTLARAHLMHQFSALWFNAGDRLYRNHLSFIKDFVPEIGRGIRFSYTLRWF